MLRGAKVSDIEACGLSYSELQELWLGPSHDGSCFDSREQVQDAWIRGRDVVMRLWGSGGRRPQAWWCFEAPGLGLTWPDYDAEPAYLFERNVLEKTECEQLLAGWRRDFEDACLLEDAVARRKHLDWAGVPHSLRQRWQAARRRRERRSASPSAPQEEAAAK